MNRDVNNNKDSRIKAKDRDYKLSITTKGPRTERVRTIIKT